MNITLEISEELLREKYAKMVPHMNEKQRRLYLATEAHMLGYGGITLVAKAAGVSRTMIYAGLQEQEEGREVSEGIRRP